MKLSDCFNWKVGIGLLAVGVALYLIFPVTIGRFAPYLIFLLCPLSMLFMMAGMRHNNDKHMSHTDKPSGDVKQK